MSESELLINFGIAAVLGALIGLEREYHFESTERTAFAGIRTFALVCLAGAVCGYLAEPLGPWIVIAGLFAVAALSIASFYGTLASCEGNIGTTTELAFIFTYLIGAVVVLGSRPAVGIALGVGLAVLLSVKPKTREFSTRIGRDDIYATLKFAIISFVILPFLPRSTFDPYGVLSLYNIWLMVVLVSAISFSGYIATKAFGGERGLGLTALLGGMWSSTASTITFSTRSRSNPHMNDSYGLAVLLACSMMFPRQIIEVYLVGRPMFVNVLLPLGVMGALGLAISAAWYVRRRGRKESEVEMTNPFSLTPALKFAVLYAAVLVVSKAASVHLGVGGLYGAALLSGMFDVNAITLSIANLVAQDKLAVDVGTNAVVIAAISNTVVKGGMTLFFGNWPLFKRVAPGFALLLGLGVAVLFF